MLSLLCCTPLSLYLKVSSCENISSACHYCCIYAYAAKFHGAPLNFIYGITQILP